MSLRIQLLGRPCLTGSPAPYEFRSRKSWALLAYLLLTERPQPRRHLAEMLFGGADDPLRALRWSVAEVRRGLGPHGSVEGDPLTLTLSSTAVDVHVVTGGSWREAVQLPTLASPLLDGFDLADAAVFDSWLVAEQRRLAAASEAILHEAALGQLAAGDVTSALEHGVRLVSLNPYDENHHALLVRLHRQAGDDAAAQKQLEISTRLLDEVLGSGPHLALSAVMAEPVAGSVVDDVTIEALVEAGVAAVAAGAVEAGVATLRTAARSADRRSASHLQVRARLALADALIHSLRGLDEEGVAALFAAERAALAVGDLVSAAQARTEIGYVDFLRARYDRAQRWLVDALDIAGEAPPIIVRATAYLGCVASDQGDYPVAVRLLGEAVARARSCDERRMEAYALSMLGRAALLRGQLDDAAQHLDGALEVARRERWLAFMPWPQALRGQVELERRHVREASMHLRQAFARACQIGDPCWEGMAARGLALCCAADGDPTGAFELLAEARGRGKRFADPYEWLDGYIIDAQCALGRRFGHPDTGQWVEALQALAERTGMKDLLARALVHRSAGGDEAAAAAARLIAADVDSPALTTLVGRL